MATTVSSERPSRQPGGLREAVRRLRRRMRPPRRLKFTRVGKYFTGMTLLVGFGAINTGNNLLYLLLGMMLSIIIVSGILSEQVLKRLEVTHRLPPRLFAGHPAPFEVTVRNPKPRVPSFSIQILERIEGVEEEDRPGAYFLRVDAGDHAQSSFRYTFARRGVYAIEGFEIVTLFPFDLFRKSRDLDATSSVIVYPHLIDPGPLTGLANLPYGQVQRPRPGRGGEFYGLKEYRLGDDVRDIHWKASAKRQELVTREREHEEARSLTICFANIWDDAACARYGEGAKAREAYARDLERAVSLAAGLAERLIDEGYVLALATLSSTVSPGTGGAQLDRVLEALAVIEFLGQNEPVDKKHRFELRDGASTVLVGMPSSLSGLDAGRVVATVPCAPQHAGGVA